MFLFLTIAMTSIGTPSPASAVNLIEGIDCSVTGEDGNTPEVCQVDQTQTATENTLVGENGLITRIAQGLVYVSGALAAILIIVAGLMFIFSSGNPESAGRARRTIMYAVVGVVVAVVGQVIVTYVLKELGAS